MSPVSNQRDGWWRVLLWGTNEWNKNHVILLVAFQTPQQYSCYKFTPFNCCLKNGVIRINRVTCKYYSVPFCFYPLNIGCNHLSMNLQRTWNTGHQVIGLRCDCAYYMREHRTGIFRMIFKFHQRWASILWIL